MEKSETKTVNTGDKPISKAALKVQQPLYTAAQIVESYKNFGTSRAIVECALKLSGREKFTIDEAQKIINNFKNKR